MVICSSIAISYAQRNLLVIRRKTSSSRTIYDFSFSKRPSRPDADVASGTDKHSGSGSSHKINGALVTGALVVCPEGEGGTASKFNLPQGVVASCARGTGGGGEFEAGGASIDRVKAIG